MMAGALGHRSAGARQQGVAVCGLSLRHSAFSGTSMPSCSTSYPTLRAQRAATLRVSANIQLHNAPWETSKRAR